MSKDGNSKNKILMAAIDEFGEMGYEHASTNNILRRAGVSKGLIFHYFESKEKLHRACVEYGLALFREYVAECAPFEEKDYFARMFRFIMCKLEFSDRQPQLTKLFADMFNRITQGELIDLHGIFAEEQQNQWNLLVTGTDTSRFREDIPTAVILEYIELAVSGVTSRFAAKYSASHEQMLTHMDELTVKLKHVEALVKNGVYSNIRTK